MGDRSYVLADLLGRRKELQEKVARLKEIDRRELYQTVTDRVSVTDSVDSVVMRVPVIRLAQLTRTYDYYAKQLRQVDSLIQRTNWSTEVSGPEGLDVDYDEPEPNPRTPGDQ